MNEAKKFLLNKGYSDFVITHPSIVDPEKWVYVSDAMMEFQRNLTDQSSQPHNICGTCDGSGQIPCPDGFAICRECWGGR